jgi:NAD(P)-dependent dehydrogenase (short-subunit alcohol dehydrogenase family)
MTDGLAAYSGRWALVTGAGDGIGRALVLGLAGAGMHVVIADIMEAQASEVAKTITARGGIARVLLVDVSDREAMIAGAQALADEGVVPALVWANAGVGAGATLVEGSPRAIEWAVSVNILGIAWTAQAFVPRMALAAGPRHFAVTASSASITDVTGPFTLYAATKHGAAGFAEALMAELAPQGIGTTILYPGLVNTNIWDAARARPERFGGAAHMPHSVGDYWRAAPGPEVLVAPALATVAAGGGRCIVDVSGDARGLFEERTAAITRAFGDWK